MTIVNISVPAIRNSDTPSGMPDRIPPRVDTSVGIIVLPDLTGSNRKITLSAVNTSATNGTFKIGGAATMDITKTTSVNLSGITQTAATLAPGGGNAGQLRLL